VSPAATSPRGLTVASSRHPGRLAELRDEWRALFDAAARPSPFLSWEWLSTWQRHFGPRRQSWVLEVRDAGGALAGALALVGRSSLAGARRFSLLGNGVTGADGLDVLARAGDAAAVRSALGRALAQAGSWDVVDLEDLPRGSPTVVALREALEPRGIHVALERRFTCPAFALRGTFPQHLARMRRRETYRRRVRWFERQPGFRIEVASPAEVPAAMEDLLRLHRLRWAAEGGSYGIPPGEAEAFHREVAPLLAGRGWLRLYRLFAGGAAIAAVYGLELNGTFYYYQSGYDGAWAARSPGLVVVGRTVEDAYARGLDDYDFLRGEEAHKLDWTADRYETVALRLRAPSVRARTAVAAEEAYRAARGLARAVAPDRMWNALRRVRRSLEVNHARA
jgi:CelD/BcsL family acetyltransferase involved in cellulose biosynthesis